ncbi:MAG: endo-1,4-beta-xylanase, partial [Verrucomicrobiales bacterium]
MTPRFIPLILAALLGSAAADEKATTAAPKADPREIGIFGIGSCHIHGRSAKDNALWIPEMREIDLRYYRTAHTHWHSLEAQKGQWKWDALDEQMAWLDERGVIYGGLLIGNPKWTGSSGLPSKSLPEWSNYVETVVTHCRDHIKRWEVWNEPPNFTAKGQTPADYAQVVRAAYVAAKKADPDCLVGLAAKSNHLAYLAQTIEAGAKDHFDYITLHPYELLNGVADNKGTEPLFLNIVPTLRKMLADKNPAKKDVPLIFTELGISSEVGVEKQAHGLVKAWALSLA